MKTAGSPRIWATAVRCSLSPPRAGNRSGKRIAGIAGTSATDLIKFAGLEQIDVLICGSLGLATRNALEMLGVLLVPGCEGSAEESVAKFLVGEKQGDPTILEIGP